MLDRSMLVRLQLRRAKRLVLAELPLIAEVRQLNGLALPPDQKYILISYKRHKNANGWFDMVDITDYPTGRLIGEKRFDDVINELHTGLARKGKGIVPFPNDRFRFPDTVDLELGSLVEDIKSGKSILFHTIGIPISKPPESFTVKYVPESPYAASPWIQIWEKRTRPITFLGLSDFLLYIDDAISGWPDGFLPDGWSRPATAYGKPLAQLKEVVG